MRRIKGSLVAAATIACLFSMSTGGVGLASAQAAATTLCSVAQETCALGNRKEAGTLLEMSSTQVTFVNTVSNVTCGGGSFKAATQAVQGEPLAASISAANAPVFVNCTREGGQACSATSVNTPYNAEIEWTAANNGTFKMTNGGSGAAALDLKCGILIKCRYNVEVQYTMEGGNPAEIKIAGAVLERISGLCPTETQLVVTYTVNAPNPVYVAHV